MKKSMNEIEIIKNTFNGNGRISVYINNEDEPIWQTAWNVTGDDFAYCNSGKDARECLNGIINMAVEGAMGLFEKDIVLEIVSIIERDIEGSFNIVPWHK